MKYPLNCDIIKLTIDEDQDWCINISINDDHIKTIEGGTLLYTFGELINNLDKHFYPNLVDIMQNKRAKLGDIVESKQVAKYLTMNGYPTKIMKFHHKFTGEVGEVWITIYYSEEPQELPY